MAARFAMPLAQWFSSLGVPAAGWRLYFYATGTSTPLATYSDTGLTTANTNPVIADATGTWGPIFLQNALYKVVLRTKATTDAPNGTLIWTVDPYGPLSNQVPVRTITTSGNINVTDGTVLVNTAGGAVTATLPSAASSTGIRITVKNLGANPVTIAGTIDGISNYILNFQYESVDLQSNGTAYEII